MFSFAKRQRESGWLAVAVMGEHLHFAHVRRQPAGVPVLQQYFSEPLPPPSSGANLCLSLQAVNKSRGLKSFRCTTLLDRGTYQIVQAEAPPVPDNEMRDALSWRLKDLVDLPSPEVTFDVLPIPDVSSGSRPRQLFLTIAENRVIEPIVLDFQGAGLNLEVIDLPEMAQRNVAALFETENRGLAFLCFYRESALLTFTFGGELFAFRRIEIGADQFAQATPERREQLSERVVLEIQRSIDTVDRQFSAISLSHMVTALPPESGLEAHFSNALYLPFEPMDLAKSIDLSAFPALTDPDAQREALLMIGAALRDEESGA